MTTKPPTPTGLDEATIERIAEIARLTLTPEERERFRKDANEILESFAKINEIEAKGSELYYLRSGDNPLRDDAAVPSGDDVGIRSQFGGRTPEGLMKAPKNL